MKILTALLGLAVCVIPLNSLAAPAHKKASAPTVYVCSKCHMKFSAGAAKKDHYKDPMDDGTLVAVKSTPVKGASPKAHATKAGTMSSMGL